MEKLIDVFANNNILVLGIVLFIFGLILLGYLLTLILVSKKHDKNNIENILEENKELVEVKEETIDSKEEIEEEPVFIEVENKQPLMTEINEENDLEVIEESKNLTIDEIKEEKINNDLEEVLQKMQKTLAEKEEMDNVERFEREQEENAIISYQELLRRAKKDFPQMEINVSNEVEKDELSEIKSQVLEVENSQDNMLTTNLETNQVNVEEKPKNIKPVEPKIPFDNPNYEFKSSIFITPLGVTNYDNTNYYKEVKIRRDYLKEMADSRFNTVDIQTDDIDYETRQNEKFLEELKSFRSNL